LEVDRDKLTGKVKATPVREELNEPVIDEQLVVEYYSR
jgi:ribosomal protein S4